MAKYRPVAHEHIWRNPRCAGLSETARHTLLYLLTGSFTNTIGAYPIQPSVAAAEMESVNCDNFLQALAELQARSMAYYANGYVVVSCWFLHNTWESTLQGKVQKAAKREFQQLPPEMQERWIESSIAAGVPADVIQTFVGKPLASPISSPEMPLQHYNGTELQQNITITTSTSTVGSGGDTFQTLMLTPAVEQYRPFIEQTLCNLPASDAQNIADECCGAIAASEAGKRPAIRGLHQWLPTLVQNFKNGTFVPQWSQAISQQRESARKQAEKAIAAASQQREEKDEYQTRCRHAEALLQSLSSEELSRFTVELMQRLMTVDQKLKARQAIESRQLSDGMIKAVIVAQTENWQLTQVRGKA
jgi:hypothetical protein